VKIFTESRPEWISEAVKLCQCDNCSLKDQCSNRVPGIGPENAEYAIVGEALGLHEEKLGEPFVGQAGQLLDKCLQAVGIRLSACWISNACICRPPQNRTPKADEIDSCNPRLEYELKKVKPKVIIALGNSAVRAVLGSGIRDGITKIRGWRFWSDRFNCYVLPTYHPAAVLRQPRTFDDFIRDLAKVKSTANLPPGGIPFVPTQYETIKTVSKALQLFEFLKKQEYVACDIETDGFELDAPLLSVGFSWDEGKAAIVPRELLADEMVIWNLGSLFESPTTKFIFHNGKFDAKHLETKLGIKVRVDEDTLLMHYCIDEREGTHGLKELAREYLEAPDWEAEIKKYLPNSKVPYSAIPPEVLHQYQANDCDYTRRLYFLFKKELEEEGTEKAYRNLLIPATNAFKDIEQHGILVDYDYLTQLKTEMEPQLEALKEEMHNLAVEVGFDPSTVPGGKLNPNSPQQLQLIMYDLLRCPPFEGARTTSIAALEAYKNRHPFLQKLMEYRQIAKLYSTYVTGFLDRLGPDHRIRTDYLLFGTVTGRLSSRDPNMQNIPRESPIKRMFIASPGHRFIEADYSQLEFRVAAHYTHEDALLEAFHKDVDIHRNVASQVFRKPPEEISDEERNIAKFTGFGVLYGRGAYSLATGEMNCSVEEAQRFIDNFFKGMPKLYQWIQNVQQQAIREGYVTTPFGRKRRFSFVHPDTIHEIRRQAVNTPIQSMASDICLSALIRLHKELRERDWGWVLFTVHDSIAFELREEVFDDAIHLIRDIMEHPPIESIVPWKVEIKAGPNWGETVKLKHD